MTEFSTSATLYAEIDQRSLRDARDTIEAELSRPLTVEANTARRPGSAAAGMKNRRGGSLTDGGRRAQSTLAELRDLQEDTVILLENISDDLGGDGVGGGGVTEVLAGIVGDVGGEAAGAAAETVGSVGGTAAGSALGTLAGEIIASKTTGGGGGTVSLEDSTVEIADGETPLAVEDVTLGVDEPGWLPLSVDDPGALGVDDPSPLQIEDAEPIPVDSPDSIPVQAPPAPNPPPSPGAPPTGGPPRSVYGTAPSTGGRGSGRGDVLPLGAALIEDLPFSETFKSLSAGAVQTVTGADREDVVLPGFGRIGGDKGSGGQRRGGSSPRNVNVTTTYDSDITVDVSGAEDIKRQIIRKVEQNHKKDIRDLRQRLDKLERAFSVR